MNKQSLYSDGRNNGNGNVRRKEYGWISGDSDQIGGAGLVIKPWFPAPVGYTQI